VDERLELIARIACFRSAAELLPEVLRMLRPRRQQDRQGSRPELAPESLLDELGDVLVARHLQPIRIDDLPDLFLGQGAGHDPHATSPV
jgi:hypothetical protein